MLAYSLLQRANVDPDKKFYAALMGVCGKAKRLDLALEMLENIAGEGILVSATIDNALIYAAQEDLPTMRRIYDLCAQNGIYPELSQYNRCGTEFLLTSVCWRNIRRIGILMYDKGLHITSSIHTLILPPLCYQRMLDWYASQSRFGDVVSLVCDMVKSGRTPNLNTYRIIINACQRADQAQLAVEVYATLKSHRIPILQKARGRRERWSVHDVANLKHTLLNLQKFEASIFYQLLKIFFNQIRYQWAWGGSSALNQHPQHHMSPFSSITPSSPAAGSGAVDGGPAPWLGPARPVVRIREAEALLTALRSSSSSSSGGPSGGRSPGGSGRSVNQGFNRIPPLLLVPPETIDWQQQAMLVYRDMLSMGIKPGVEVRVSRQGRENTIIKGLAKGWLYT